jgi:hypothetical protein
LIGFGKIIFKNGDRFEGTFKRDKREGNGTMYYINGDKYVGNFKDDRKEGKGNIYYFNGDEYVGDFKGDKCEGNGTLLYANGDRYIGSYKSDRKDGNGTHYFASGDRHEGSYKADKREGHGIVFHVNGDKFEGDFKADQKDGRGTEQYTNGDKYEGDYREGYRHGKGTLFFANGDTYSGDYRNDLRHGKGKLVFSSGTVFEGDFSANKIEGMGVLYTSKGDRYEGKFVDGHLEGKGVLHHSNGKFVEGNFTRGVLRTVQTSSDKYGVAIVLATTILIMVICFALLPKMGAQGPSSSGSVTSVYANEHMTNEHTLSDIEELDGDQRHLAPSAPQTRTQSVTSTSSNNAEECCDAFLSHNWGPNGINHDRVRKINCRLQNGDNKLTTWFDENCMHGDIRSRMQVGVENASVVVVFLTNDYLEKINTKDRRDNCNFEFNHAFEKKGNKKMVVVILEADLLVQDKWKSGLFGAMLGGNLYVDMSSGAFRDAKIDELKFHICKAIGTSQ